MEKITNTEIFIKRAKLVHGDKYDYSKTRYINSTTKLTIICPIHGEFQQMSVEHVKGKGCYKCGREKTKLTLDEFIIKANRIHNNKYNYSKVKFNNTKDKIIIICPIHGEFTQTVNSHLNGTNCKQCTIDDSKLGKEEFIRKAKCIFGDYYDYSKVNYVNNRTNVILICKKHGEFEVRPLNHLHGENCKYCNYDKLKLSNEDFINKANEVHNFKYDYSITNYGNNGKEKVKIICKEHGIFEQTPNIHLRGSGCPKCKLKSQTKLYDRLLFDTKEKILFEYSPDFLNRQRFDMYFPKYNIAVEYNGEQHYVEKEHFGGKLGFEKTLERDNLKRIKCKNNNCYLFEVKYNYDENDYEDLLYNILLIIKSLKNEN